MQAGSDVDSDEGQPDMIPVEFESVACEADDFHRMQPLLSQLVRKSDVNVSTIIDVILSQPTMGAVIKVCPPDAEPNSGSAGEKEKAGAAKKEMAEAAAAEKEAGAAGDGVTEDADGSAVDETVYSMTTLLNLHEHKVGFAGHLPVASARVFSIPCSIAFSSIAMPCCLNASVLHLPPYLVY